MDESAYQRLQSQIDALATQIRLLENEKADLETEVRQCKADIDELRHKVDYG